MSRLARANAGALLDVRVRRGYMPPDVVDAFHTTAQHVRRLVLVQVATDVPPPPPFTRSELPRYVVSCEHHGSVSTAYTRAEARARGTNLDGWCRRCSGGDEDRLAGEEHPLAMLRAGEIVDELDDGTAWSDVPATV